MICLVVSENTLAFSVLSGAQRGVNICYSFVLSERKRNKGRKGEGEGGKEREKEEGKEGGKGERKGKREGRKERRKKRL